MNNPVNKIDPSGLQDIFGFVEIDVVGIFGFTAGLGFVVDIDNFGESGVFFSSGGATGGSIGIAVGGGGVSEVEGTSVDVDFNYGKYSVTNIFDESGYNGLAITIGPGIGRSVSISNSSTITINDFILSLNEIVDQLYEEYQRMINPCR